MDMVSVTIEDMAGKKFKAQLPSGVSVSRLLPQLITRMGLASATSGGRPLSYRLVHLESGIQLRDDDTLEQTQVREGHTLRVIAELIAGAYGPQTDAWGPDPGGTVSIILEDTSARKFAIQISNDISVNKLIPVLLNTLQIPPPDFLEQRFSYHLFHLESGKQIRDDYTLEQAQVREGDTVKLIVGSLTGEALPPAIPNEDAPPGSKTVTSVTIEDMAGKKFKAQLPSGVSVSRLLPQLIAKLGLTFTDRVGRRLSYRLIHLESGMQLRDDNTLEQAQIRDGHTLRLLADLEPLLIVRYVYETAESDTIEPNEVDRIAMRFFQETALYFPFRPDKDVYPLPVNEDGLDLHWFQVRREHDKGKTWPNYIDVFCVSTFNRFPTKRLRQLQNNELLWENIESKYYDLLALTRPSTSRVINQVLKKVSQEELPVINDKFILIIPRFPEEGIHLLIKPLDFAPEKATPIPFDIPMLEEALSRSRCLELLNDNLYYWLNRVNRYHRTDPVTGLDYYRRDDIEVQIRDCITQGQAFGLFGLRRMGKSSILLEMKRKESFGHACACVLNMQGFGGRSIWAVFSAAMQEWLQHLTTVIPSETKDAFSLTKMRIAPEERIDLNFIREEIERLINILPEKMRLVLVLDEIGEILPSPPDYQQALFSEWRQFLGFLRTLSYESEHRFVLGVAAYGSDITDDTLGDANRNPWLRQIKPIWIRPLTRLDCDRMVQDIGAMAGVYYTPDALSLLYASTNGHPQITRELCNLLVEQTKDQPHTVEATEVKNIIEKYMADNASIRVMYSGLQLREQQIVLHLARVQETESAELYAALKQLFKDAADFEETLGKMIRYGLVQKEESVHKRQLKFGPFKNYQKEELTPKLQLKFGLFKNYLTELIRLGEC